MNKITEQDATASERNALLCAGDIIVNERYEKGTMPPKMFKCTAVDSDFGVVYYNRDIGKDCYGFSSIRKANFFEKIIWWLFYK